MTMTADRDHLDRELATSAVVATIDLIESLPKPVRTMRRPAPGAGDWHMRYELVQAVARQVRRTCVTVLSNDEVNSDIWGQDDRAFLDRRQTGLDENEGGLSKQYARDLLGACMERADRQGEWHPVYARLLQLMDQAD